MGAHSVLIFLSVVALSGLPSLQSALAATEHVESVNGDNYVNNPSRGNRGYILVNQPTNVGNGIVRSLWIGINSNNQLEVGWLNGSDWSTNGNPYVFFWEKVNGFPSLHRYLVTNPNTNHQFAILDSGDTGTYYFYLDGTKFGVSGQMPTGGGLISTNSERHSDGDSLYAHFYSLQYWSGGSSGSWSGYGGLTCANNTSNSGGSTYYFNKVSNTEEYVKLGTWGC